MIKTRPFDIAAQLDSPEMIAGYLSEAFETGDASYISHALGMVARAKGMAALAKQAGLSRESLYKALSSEGRPEFITILKVMKALELDLKVETSKEHATT